MHVLPRRAAGLAALTLAAATGLAACSSSKATTNVGAAASGSSTASSASASCGTVPTATYSDAGGLIKALGSQYDAAYSGYSGTVSASAWATWKPTKTSGFTVGISESSLGNPYQTLIFNELKSKLTSYGYKVIAFSDATTVTAQLSEFNQLVTDKVDLIIYQPLGSGFNSAVDAAAKAGIPSISVLNNVVDANTVNIVPNAFEAGEAQAAAVAKIMNGSGTILGVHGIQGVPIDSETFAGAKAALALCSGITLKDSIYTDFTFTKAQSEVTSYLAANPTAKIGGVLEGGPMTTGIIAAFQKSGETVPTIADNGLTTGGVAYWEANKSSYQGVGLYNPGDGLADAAAAVAKDMLSGDGVKVSDIVIAPTLVTSDNLSSFYKSSFTVGTPSTVAESDVNQPFATSDYLAAFFTTTPSS
jgi:ABC-type xylose transport system substrate-binding protein